MLISVTRQVSVISHLNASSSEGAYFLDKTDETLNWKAQNHVVIKSVGVWGFASDCGLISTLDKKSSRGDFIRFPEPHPLPERRSLEAILPYQ